ncbi:RNA-dependent RNA polymerase family protein [Paraburkholderia xenovorans]|uniref:hypothetical protein n=1 Tax=Paraburkholderia xenovorans TaxID=36873 RepID=UPI0038BD25A2
MLSPLFSNIYLIDVDRMPERAKEAARNGKYTYVGYARFADDLAVLIDAHPRHAWLLRAVTRRLQEKFAKLQVEVNKDNSRTGLYEELKLFNGYRVRPAAAAKARPA